MNTRLAKKAFIEAYKKTFGNITQSCEAIKISRGTYYNWYQKDDKFKKTINELEPDERLIDFTFSKLIQLIDEGDKTAIIFTLKTLGKNRGFVERQEIVQDTKIDSTLVQWHPAKEQ